MIGLSLSSLSSPRSLSSLRSPRSLSSLRTLSSLLALLALLTLTACTSGSSSDAPGEETPDNPTQPVQTEKPITFSSGLANEEAVTRAEGLETVAKTFKVWAYKNMSYDGGSYGVLQTVIDGYTVNWVQNTALTTESNTDDWEYVNQQPTGQLEQTIKYWDWSAKAYRFFGWAPGKAGENITPITPQGAQETQEPQGYTLTISGLNATSDETIAAAPYFSKLWFSNGNPADYPNRRFGYPVKLEFLKPFARVRYLFTFADGLTLTDNDLSEPLFHPTATDKSIAVQGTVTITYPLTGSGTEYTWTSSPESSSSGNAYLDRTQELGKYDKWYTVLPMKNQGTYTLSVVVVGGEPQTTVVPAEYMTWAPGHQYTYIFKILEGGEVVLENLQVFINDWNVTDNVDHTIYNW